MTCTVSCLLISKAYNWYLRKSLTCPITSHISILVLSTCAYIPVLSTCAYIQYIYQSVTDPLMSKITVLLLIESQIVVAGVTFFINYDVCLRNMSEILNIEQHLFKLIKILEIKFTCFCLVLTIYHTIASFWYTFYNDELDISTCAYYPSLFPK